MKLDVNVNVHHLTRVEGHGNIVVQIKNGAVIDARWDVVETPRYFEAILRGKHYTSAAILTARICGICSIGHALASVRATEDAFGVLIPPLSQKLRLLAKHAETLQSHVLHVLFLAAPDFLGLDSAIPLLTTRPDLFALAGRLKNVANRLADAVAGRTTHPVSIQVGGMAKAPDKHVLRALRPELAAVLDDLGEVRKILGTLELPTFSRETEFVSLKGDGAYPWIGGRLVSSDGVDRVEQDYRAMTNEYVTANNTSKWCKLSRPSFAVGALARFNNNHQWLGPAAKEAAEALGLVAPNYNPFMNNIAQVVEAVQVTHDSIALIDELLDTDESTPTRIEVQPRKGHGVGAVEVPRGILYHAYEYDDQGYLTSADCVIPTTQNNANIHHDIKALAEEFAAQGVDNQRLELLCSMLVRSYDPCISCSVH